MKKKSIARYLMNLLIISEILIAVIVIFVIRLYVLKAIDLEVRSYLTREITNFTSNMKKMQYGAEVDFGNINQENSDTYICVFDKDGNLLWGSYPKGFVPDSKIHYAPCEVELEEGTFCYFDRESKYTRDKDDYIRAMVKKSKLSKKYIRIQLLYYGGTALLLFIFSMIEFLIFRKMVRSLNEMKNTVETITGSNRFNLSGRMTNDGPFLELDILAQANNRMLDRMEEMFSQQEQFTADVAHELKTPISVIKAECQYVSNKDTSLEEMKGTIEVIARQAEKMNEMLVTLLELSRLDQEDFLFEEETVELAEIVQSVCEMEQENLGEEDRIICTELKSVITRGDVYLVTIAVGNLVSNAVKFSGEHGKIYVRTGENEDMVFVTVRDEGIGMTQEVKDNIFKRFYKGDYSRRSKGYGLGMPLTMKIAQKHGGTVEVKSTPGIGSEFCLLLQKK